MNITSYVEDKQGSEFYPTPKMLARKMINGIEWSRIQTVLEPSAGKGDILKILAEEVGDKFKLDIDCIEIDRNLRQILKYVFSEEAKEEIIQKKYCITQKYGRSLPGEEQIRIEQLDTELMGFFENGIHVVHDDFLTYQAYKEYDIILMNPPFSNGDRHLLKALEIQRNGGSIVCLLNADTLRHPYTESRKQLVKLLNEYQADIEYIEDAFLNAERKAKVDIALIKVRVPDHCGQESIFERLAKAQEYSEPSPGEALELEVSDYIQAAVNRYKVEIQSGIELIKTYKRMLPYLSSSFDKKDRYGYEKPIIALTDGESGSHHEMTVNKYVKAVRLKYWRALLSNDRFIGRLTSKLQQEYRERVCRFANYEFSEFNIRVLVVEMNSQIRSGIEDEIFKMYDKLTEEHTYYPECVKNRYLYDGWKTNKAWKIGKKSILPCYGVFNSWNGKPSTYNAYWFLADIERILNFFDGNMCADMDLNRQLDLSFQRGLTKNIQCKFFNVTFYKKGTVHITFTCPELIDRFNIYVGKGKNWLPPSYGKKQYKDMTNEEKSVIDSFQGKEGYTRVLKNAEYYLASPIERTEQLLEVNDGTR